MKIEDQEPKNSSDLKQKEVTVVKTIDLNKAITDEMLQSIKIDDNLAKMLIM